MPLDTTLTTDSEEVTTSSYYVIKQGDAVNNPVTITIGEETLDGDDVALMDVIEFMIGHCVRKVVPADESWSSTAEAFLFPLDQADTLRIRPGIYDFDCRVKFSNGSVMGMHNRQKIRILDAMSREVI